MPFVVYHTGHAYEQVQIAWKFLYEYAWRRRVDPDATTEPRREPGKCRAGVESHSCPLLNADRLFLVPKGVGKEGEPRRQ